MMQAWPVCVLGLLLSACAQTPKWSIVLHGGSGTMERASMDAATEAVPWSFNTSGMYRARMSEGGTPQVAIFKDEP